MIVLPCDKKGSGSVPVVFLHGYCEGRWIWDDCLPDPGDQFTFLSYDLPGFGESAHLPEVVSMASVAEIVLENIRAITASPPVIIGHSLGGYVALAMAAADPAGIAGLGLIHSTIYQDTEEKKQNRKKVAASVMNYGPGPFLETFADGLFADPASDACRRFRHQCGSTRPEAIAAYALAMRDRPDRAELWSHLQVPLLLIAGRQDRLTTAEMMQTIAQCNMLSQFFILEHSAHAGMLEEPAALRQMMGGFLTLFRPEMCA
jgi:pimeloyl-ACP methyl ester carboxylesterase